MILRDNLYTIEHSDMNFEGAYSAMLKLNGDCEIYAAHFPGRPVTPGVCIIQMFSELAEYFTGKKLQLASVRNAKFMAAVDPIRTPDIQVDMTIKMNMHSETSVSGIVRANGVPAAKLSLIYTT